MSVVDLFLVGLHRRFAAHLGATTAPAARADPRGAHVARKPQRAIRVVREIAISVPRWRNSRVVRTADASAAHARARADVRAALASPPTLRTCSL